MDNAQEVNINLRPKDCVLVFGVVVLGNLTALTMLGSVSLILKKKTTKES